MNSMALPVKTARCFGVLERWSGGMLEIRNSKSQITMTQILGVRCQGGKAVTTKNYMDVEDRGQNLEVGGQKSDYNFEITASRFVLLERFD